jgi:hypothetical protein
METTTTENAVSEKVIPIVTLPPGVEHPTPMPRKRVVMKKITIETYDWGWSKGWKFLVNGKYIGDYEDYDEGFFEALRFLGIEVEREKYAQD